MADMEDIYDTEEGLKGLADYLRGSHGVKLREAVEHDRRVQFFKGEKFVACVLKAEKWPKSLPVITTEEQALAVGQKLIKNGYLHCSEKHKEKKRVLVVSQRQVFEPKGYYTWMYEGPKTWSNLMTGLLIVGFLLMTCFPIWPIFLKVWLWYLSVTLLGIITVVLSTRGLVFVLVWITGYDFWIFPRMFDESLGFTESFVPIYSVEKSPAGQGLYRLALLAGFVAFGCWAYMQPTEFDDFVSAQKQFVTDIYEGNLLADVAQEAKENIDKPRVPNLEDLLRELDEEVSEEQQAEDEIIAQLMEEHENEDFEN